MEHRMTMTEVTVLTEPMQLTGTRDHSEHRALLVALYLELSAEIEQAVDIVGTWSNSVGEGGDDEVDTGSRSAQREQDAAVLASIRERRQQVERSIERIDAGVYGQCEGCRKPIPAARLEAFPSATTCVACKRHDERRM
jgi:DnaK suppressor protein